MWKELFLLFVAVCVTVAACSSSTDDLSVREMVEQLSADEMLGRDNLTEGTVLARTLLIKELEGFAEPIAPEA